MAGQSRNRVTVLPLWQRLIRERCFHPSGRFIKFEFAEIENSISKRFEEQVRRHPNRLAVKAESCGMTYSQLNRAGNRIAGSILAQREDQEKPAAVLMEHGKSLITSIIGVFKSAKIFVPIDPSLPISEITRMLEDSNPNIVVTNHRNAALAHRLAQNALRVVNIDELDRSISDINPNLPVSADKIAWIMYTSGSTGQPKGTAQSHRNVLHDVMNHINTFRISPNDRLILLDSCSTVGGMKDTLSALLNGSALFPFDLRERNLIELATCLKRDRITIYRSFATVFRHLVATMAPGEVYRDLRLIYLGGEPAYKEDLAAFSQRFSPGCIFTSGLGSTEALTYRHCLLQNGAAIDGHTVPVGFDVEGMGVLLLDENDKEVVPGQIGEITVKSRYLSPGYWRRPDLTQTAFINHPNWSEERLYRTGDLGRMLPDGCLLHHGRKDSQVKIGGRRVDIFELEAILLEKLQIKEVAVVAKPDQLGGQRLIAYVVPKDESPTNVNPLRKILAYELPDHMIPSVFVLLEAMPLTSNGKVNRRALPPPGDSRPRLEETFVPPRTPVEHKLVKIWASVLGIERIGINDIFLDLGGNSLLATQIVSRVITEFGVELPIKALLAAATPANMAVAVTQNMASKRGDQELERLLEGLEDVS